jgi:hypothetical protein
MDYWKNKKEGKEEHFGKGKYKTPVTYGSCIAYC